LSGRVWAEKGEVSNRLPTAPTDAAFGCSEPTFAKPG
jgi:hypothetical protein